MNHMEVLDRLSRPLTSLRLSVTDRCNLRCQYCMPEQDYVWLPRADILTFEEIDTLVDVFTGVGVDRVRITGGEPLLRKNLAKLIALLARKTAIEDLVSGRRDDMDAVLIAKQKADMAFQLLLQVRNKMVDAYEEIKQMRV